MYSSDIQKEIFSAFLIKQGLKLKKQRLENLTDKRLQTEALLIKTHF